MEPPKPEAVPRQYTVPKTLAIWAAAALPMGILGWVAAPLLSRGSHNPGFVRLAALTVGLVWQFCLVVWLVRKETGSFDRRALAQLLWLRKPRSPSTGKTNGWLWLWIVPLVLVTAAFEMKASGLVDTAWVAVAPVFAEPPNFGLASYLGSSQGRAEMAGAWGTLLLFVVNAVFNTFLGEELLFRGLLLPRMRGAFGKWAWVANGVLFALYHLHQPWGVPSSAIAGALLFALPTALFRSSWFGIVLHSGQSVFFTLILLGMVLGLA